MKKIAFAIIAIFTIMAVSCGNDEPAVVRINPEAIDLGLSVKWASFNIGAYDAKYTGALYGWADSLGEHRTVNRDYPVMVSYSMVGDHEITKVSWKSPYFGGYSPLENITGTEFDIARGMWSKDWRLPTRQEMQELIDKCTWTLESPEGSDVRAYRVTGPNGNSILLPLGGIRPNDYPEQRNVAGYYWTSNLLLMSQQATLYYESSVPCCAWAMTIDPSSTEAKPAKIEPQVRCYGLSVRPVAVN